MRVKDRNLEITGQHRHSRGLFLSLCSVILVSVLLAFARPEAVSAHGVGYRRSAKKAIALEFYYSTGETMAYLDARVYSPQDEKNAFQSGRTDEFGRCSFIPTAEGEWRVVVRDEEGHRAEAKIPITSDFLNGGDGNALPAAAESSLPQGADLFIRSLLGVSLIFNIAVFVRLRKCI
ncbi:MAG: hypothetical protein LBQ58_08890 [Synergistaceae bacterium]|nr:hypothetical protein [Synergistaceae bacterium]